MPVSQYIPHLIYSLALTSLSFHLLYQRKQSEVDRAHLTAQTTILESLAHQLRSGSISDEEAERLSRLAKTHDPEIKDDKVQKEKIRWRDVFLGRKMDEDRSAKDSKILEESEWTWLSQLVLISNEVTVRKEIERP